MSRQDLGASPAARLACREALGAAHVTLDDIALFDLYSCFPIAVFNVCDGLGLSPQDPRGLTVTGGLPYFGGPGNSYSTHAIASMVEKLRERRDTFGLVGANGGHMSKYAVGVYSTRPAQFTRCDSSRLAGASRLMAGAEPRARSGWPGDDRELHDRARQERTVACSRRRSARWNGRALPGEHARRGRPHAARDDRGRSAGRSHPRALVRVWEQVRVREAGTVRRCASDRRFPA